MLLLPTVHQAFSRQVCFNILVHIETYDFDQDFCVLLVHNNTDYKFFCDLEQ